ncbi:hypothetical protein H4R33_000795 [Dimargaris cristalligena]|nr:hypothetical protein H4R33_000795 [Dimargaris cristalligena]
MNQDERLLMGYTPFDRNHYEAEIKRQTQHMQDTCHAIVDDMANLVSELANILSDHMESQVADIHRRFQTQAQEIQEKEEYQGKPTLYNT